MISASDADNIYEIPLMMQEQGLDRLACDRLGLVTGPPDMREWEAVVERVARRRGQRAASPSSASTSQLQDAYLSVVEALNHPAIHHGTELEMIWVDAETLSKQEARASWQRPTAC